MNGKLIVDLSYFILNGICKITCHVHHDNSKFISADSTDVVNRTKVLRQEP